MNKLKAQSAVGSSELVMRRRMVRKLRRLEKKYAKAAQEHHPKKESDEWWKGWLQGTSNAMGWVADKLAAA